MVGFTHRPRRPRPPEPPPEPTPSSDRDGVRTISVSHDEPTRDELRVAQEVARRVPLERVVEVLAMAPGGAASASELAAWFGVPEGPLAKLLRSWGDTGDLARVEGGRFRVAAGG